MPRSDARDRSRCARRIVVTFVAALALASCDRGAADGTSVRRDLADVRGVPFRSAPPVVAETPPAPIVEAPVVAPPPAEAPATSGGVATAESAALVADPPAPEPEPAAATQPEHEPKYRKLTWDEISKYVYVPPSPPSADPMEAIRKPHPEGEDIPEKVRALSGTRVAIEGHVLPLDFKDGKVSRFIVLRSPLACCFAEAPPMNQWISATNRSDSEIDFPKYEVVRVSGEFDVGEETRDGYVVGIYRLAADKVERLE
jgi:hypothetical protein